MSWTYYANGVLFIRQDGQREVLPYDGPYDSTVTRQEPGPAVPKARKPGKRLGLSL